jgi:hypothetical protein
MQYAAWQVLFLASHAGKTCDQCVQFLLQSWIVVLPAFEQLLTLQTCWLM